MSSDRLLEALYASRGALTFVGRFLRLRDAPRLPQDVFGRSSVQASGVDSRTAGFAARVTAADAPGRYSADDTRGGGVVGVAPGRFARSV